MSVVWCDRSHVRPVSLLKNSKMASLRIHSLCFGVSDCHSLWEHAPVGNHVRRMRRIPQREQKKRVMRCTYVAA